MVEAEGRHAGGPVEKRPRITRFSTEWIVVSVNGGRCRKVEWCGGAGGAMKQQDQGV